jgi:DNA-binding response OmpR family regulator
MAIKRLRDKLGTPPDDPPYISTVRGVGYRLETDVDGEDARALPHDPA